MKKLAPLCFLWLFWAQYTSAQVGIMNQMQGEGNGMIMLNTQLQRASSYFMGQERLESIPVYEELHLHRTTLEGAYGINQRFDLQFSLAYHLHYGLSNGALRRDLGLENREQGIQDFSVMGRYLLLDKYYRSARLLGFGNLKLSTPIGNYQVSEDLQSLLALGNSAFRGGGGFSLIYETQRLLFGRISTGYTYASGKVPAYVENYFSLGMDHKDIFVEIYLQNKMSLSGPDVFGEGFTGAFPFANIAFQRLGIEIFKPIGSGVGMNVAGYHTLGGRNTFRSTGISLGVSYLFGVDEPKYNHY